ncbi:carbohydrate-binding protein [Curtobacterium sp. MCJR17_043]|uniref:carbohydrate-binding protein n=1 Tax=Curtobacterium sp. MCJR17_043 TaxID=2175660 RepID=UPI0032E8794F
MCSSPTCSARASAAASSRPRATSRRPSRPRPCSRPTTRRRARTRCGTTRPPTSRARRSSGTATSTRRSGGPRATCPTTPCSARTRRRGSSSARCSRGEKPVAPLTLPKGTYAGWSGTAAYDTGDRVLFDGTPYQAKWWNTGESPEASTSDPDGSPWTRLKDAEVKEILQDVRAGKAAPEGATR